MRKFLVGAGMLVVLFGATGCEEIDYDNEVAECRFTTDGYALKIDLLRDTDSSTNDDTPVFFGDLCNLARDGFTTEYASVVSEK